MKSKQVWIVAWRPLMGIATTRPVQDFTSLLTINNKKKSREKNLHVNSLRIAIILFNH